ncbi:MAG: hypothetical protein IKO57_11000 [Treponema sp.]|nr:hypothetical protein [Treponema sp.]MBR4630946.1 hypothetical protein [Treponema sp.]
MNLTPLCDLKERIENIIFAGTTAIKDDFKLKKAYEAFAPLASASPVFAKINDGMQKVFESDSESLNENLLDVLSLVDAVFYAQSEPTKTDKELKFFEQFTVLSGNLDYIELSKPVFEKEFRKFRQFSHYHYLDDDDLKFIFERAGDFRFFPEFLNALEIGTKLPRDYVARVGVGTVEEICQKYSYYIPKDDKRLMAYFAFLVYKFDGENKKYAKEIKRIKKLLEKKDDR